MSIILILVTFFFLFMLFDVQLNSMIAEWFTAKFLKQEVIDQSLVNKEVMNNIFDWEHFRKYCIGAAFGVICFLVIGSQLLTIRREKRARKQERERVEALVDRMLKGDPAQMFPAEYGNIGRKIESLIKEEEKEREESIRENERSNNMITYLAHDLRTPLTSIIGYLKLFLDVPDMPEDVKQDYLKKTLNKANHLEDLIRDFFEMTKYNSNKITLNKQKIDLNYMLVQLSDEFYPILESKNLQIEVEVDKDLFIFVDAEKMGRVFSNLLKNACNYSFEYTIIRIEVLVKEETVEINFINKGEPIPKERRKQIFYHFVRLDESRSSDSGGAGVGLAIVKEIVNQHDGDIVACTESGNNVFKITLPYTEE